MASGTSNVVNPPGSRAWYRLPLPRSYSERVGRMVFLFVITVQGLAAFGLITLGVIFTKFRTAEEVTLPLIFRELRRSGVELVPMFCVISIALGLGVIEPVVRFWQVGALQYIGTIMVSAVVRELGPLLTAMLVLSRSGAANVIELGTARALGEVESLEALGIDPIHYFVMPRVIGMAAGTFALTVYFIMGTVLSGYVWAFLQNVPIQPGEYFQQIAQGLNAIDFIILALKSSIFGMIIAVVTCYHGLAQPLRLEQVSGATVGAVAQTIIACVIVDALFVFLYSVQF